jgi:glycosyltransferase involved in cell wall biosynthesis
MHRICGSLAANGYQVTLIGRKLPHSLPLSQKSFRQRRLKCFFHKGFLFYAEYNLRLFFFLLLQKMDGICAIDLDTILPCLFVSKIKNIPRIYDAHEFFTELKEVRTRPLVHKVWLNIEKFCLPGFKNGYTVSTGLAEEFKKRYNSGFLIIRNISVLKPLTLQKPTHTFLLYQGAVNEGRCFEYLIPAMQQISYKLVICGDGNFMPQLKKLVKQYKVTDRVEIKGMLLPGELKIITNQATLGINLVEKDGLNQYYSLPNKFFDYIHAAVPQISMNYPEYRQINQQFRVAVLLDELSAEAIAFAINTAMNDSNLLNELRENCLKAREVLNWQNEERKLLDFYQSIFPSPS